MDASEFVRKLREHPKTEVLSIERDGAGEIYRVRVKLWTGKVVTVGRWVIIDAEGWEYFVDQFGI